MATLDREALASEIESLLDAGINLDQIMVLESEEFRGQTRADRSKLLRSTIRHAMANAEKIRDARELLLRLA